MAGRPKAAITKREAIEVHNRIKRIGVKYPTGKVGELYPKAATVIAWRIQVVTGNDASATLAFGKVVSSQFPTDSKGNHPFVLTSDGTVIDHGAEYDPKRGSHIYWGNPPKDDFNYTWTYSKSPKLTKDFETWTEEFLKLNPKLDATITAELEAYRHEKTPEYKASKQADEHRENLSGRFQSLAYSISQLTGPYEPKDIERATMLEGVVKKLKAQIEESLADSHPQRKAGPKKKTVKAK